MGLGNLRNLGIGGFRNSGMQGIGHRAWGMGKKMGGEG